MYIYIYSVCKLDCWSWSIYMCRFLELGSCIVVQQDLPARHVPVCADQICERRALSEKDTPILVFGSSLLFFGPRSSPCQNAISIHIRCHFNDHAAR